MTLIPPTDSGFWGSLTMSPAGPFTAGERVSIRFLYAAGAGGFPRGARLRIGIPNTGWEKPVVPQQRYWDELISGSDRRLAPFHPVNTTIEFPDRLGVGHSLAVMERMLVPDEDPAFAYWRWWITLTLEDETLAEGERIEILYGDRRFGSDGARVQTFAESGINVTAYIEPAGQGHGFVALHGTPVFFDVVAGPASRANVVLPSVRDSESWTARVSVTDECQCVPAYPHEVRLRVNDVETVCSPRKPAIFSGRQLDPEPLRIQAVSDGEAIRGRSNPSVRSGSDGFHLFWGDLHAQSEHHVMHSQSRDFRQDGWSKGISCGTLDECYAYARQVSLLDFIAITDQGACLTSRWEQCQDKVRQYHSPGEFITFKAYEAGATVGHRNVFYSSDEIEPPLPTSLGGFHPTAVFGYYRGRRDVIIIPHHVKTWTDWSFHDPELEPLMEIYSCWGQSESPGADLWNKGQTPGAGAWEALRRGYRLGMIASSDNHVGMPGRSYPGDRQVHTPFKGGLCAIWAENLSRESLFQALKARRCYGTTGERIIVGFSMDGAPMGSILPAADTDRRIDVEVHGTDVLDRVEVIHNLRTVAVLRTDGESASLVASHLVPAHETGFWYLRIFQKDGERAWTSPIWVE